jgi:GYF domain 2
MAEIQWWYARDDQQLGPVSPGDLRRLASGGGLAPTDLVWREGMTEWAPAVRIKGLFPELREPADETAPPQVAASPGLPNQNAAPRGPSTNSAFAGNALPGEQSSVPSNGGFSPTDAGGPEMFGGDLPGSLSPGGPPIDSGLFRAAGLMDEPEAPPMTEPLVMQQRPPRPSRIPLVLTLGQGVLWGTCGLVVLLGGILFSVSRMRGTTRVQDAETATVLGMFFIGAYVVAQAGEKISRLVLSFLERRRDD